MFRKIQNNFVVLPILYLFISIFLVRGKVLYVYFAALILVVLTAIIAKTGKFKSEKFLACWITTLASIGLSAAVILSIEKIELLIEPNHIASCSISPVVACSPVISSPQASVFGFANSFIGIFAFSAVLTAGITILAGATKLSKVWWRTLLSGILFGAVFSTWLIHEGIYDIGKLCLYCMLVWLVSFALLWMTTAHAIKKNYINFGEQINKLLTYKYELITTTYVIIFAIIFFRWSEYWVSLF